ncbi:SEC-C metal-binding domain-containing protein [Lewinella sp. IMCC34191]|uniref:SEC-C metal-binding domain-containing protein n=1 Tax=Lewinella sp. IMCC34191 TaxID=2259172 RepID=UPI0018E4DDED|nr:SEC-C metal-binding domain-containing protein [Lewinella sp. IMCC34191]
MQLTHPELNILRSVHKDELSRQHIDTILALPRETLVRDLRTILRNDPERSDELLDEAEFEGHWERLNGPFFAMRFLAILGEREALDDALDIYRLPRDLFDAFIGDWSEEDFTVFYPLLKDRMDLFFGYLKEPGHDWYQRAILNQLGTRMYVSEPDRREEIIQHYEQLTDHLLGPAAPDTVADPNFVSGMVTDWIDTKEEKFIPLVERLYAAGLVIDSFAGNLNEIKSGFTEMDYEPKGLKLPQSPYDYFPRRRRPQPILAKPRPKQRKIGRNEPCPCGSGRKYKRCCLTR